MTNNFSDSARLSDGAQSASQADSAGLINTISYAEQLAHNRNEREKGSTEISGLALANFDGKSINFAPAKVADDAGTPQARQQAIVEVDKPFDLGVPKDKLPPLGKTLAADPKMQERVFALSGEPAGEPTVYNGVAADGARVNGMHQMIGKYGVQRFNETLDKLAQIGGGKVDTYAHDLRVHFGEGGAQLNGKLRQLSTLMEPGRIEQAAEVANLLKNDGYEKRLSLAQMTDPRLMDLLKNSPAERKALIEFEHSTKTSLAALNFIRENPDALKLKPSETLDAFKRWSAKRK